MPTIPLPSDPSFENLKKQAKTLHKAVRNRDAEALARVKEFHPRGAAAAKFLLSDAQLVTARHYGFPSWPRLKEHLVDVVDKYSWAPSAEPFKDAVDEFIRLSCLDYQYDHTSRRDKARQIFSQHPEYARANLPAAATVGDVAAVRAMLAKNPKLANERCGPHRWPPLLYACYSRLNSSAKNHSTLEVARVLLEHGADPNAGFLWHGLNCPCTGLTGVLGEGENGTHQPPHQYCLELARLLLEAGADSNDAQALYNRHFNRNNDYLELLFEYGLGKNEKGPWFKRMGQRLPKPAAMIAEEVWNAAKGNKLERIKLLAKHGVELDAPGMRDGRTPYETALLQGSRDIADFLRQKGARKVELSPRDQFAAACVSGDAKTVEALLKKDPGLKDALGEKGQTELLCRATGLQNHAGIRFMAKLGFNLDGVLHGAAMHQAAWGDDLETVKLLVELGASPHVHDRDYNSTPLGWAMHNNQQKVVEYLVPMAGIFDAVAYDMLDRLTSLLKKEPGLVHTRDPLGQTALHWLNAGVKRGTESIELLVSNGADVNARSSKGETALDKMITVGRNDLADVLRRHGAKVGEN